MRLLSMTCFCAPLCLSVVLGIYFIFHYCWMQCHGWFYYYIRLNECASYIEYNYFGIKNNMERQHKNMTMNIYIRFQFRMVEFDSEMQFSLYVLLLLCFSVFVCCLWPPQMYSVFFVFQCHLFLEHTHSDTRLLRDMRIWIGLCGTYIIAIWSLSGRYSVSADKTKCTITTQQQ